MFHAHAVMNALSLEGARAETSETPRNFRHDWRCPWRLREAGDGLNCVGTAAECSILTLSARYGGGGRSHSATGGDGLTSWRFANSEATTAFQGLYQALDVYWVNEPALDAIASHKPYQLALAQKIGLGISLTSMTNDVQEARSFFRQHEGEVIYRASELVTFGEMRRLRPEDEAHAASIEFAPVIFQGMCQP